MKSLQQSTEFIEVVHHNIEEERMKDILAIEQELTDMVDIFQDLSKIVNSQKEGIEQIQEKVEEATDKVEGTIATLKETEKLATKARSKVGIIIGTLIGGGTGGLLGLVLGGPIGGIFGLVMGAGTGGASTYAVPKILDTHRKDEN